MEFAQLQSKKVCLLIANNLPILSLIFWGFDPVYFLILEDYKLALEASKKGS